MLLPDRLINFNLLHFVKESEVKDSIELLAKMIVFKDGKSLHIDEGNKVMRFSTKESVFSAVNPLSFEVSKLSNLLLSKYKMFTSDTFWSLMIRSS